MVPSVDRYHTPVAINRMAKHTAMNANDAMIAMHPPRSDGSLPW